MSDFDIKEEAEALLCQLPHRDTAARVALLLDFATRLRDATEEADIKAMCSLCEPEIPVAEIDGEWMHSDPDDETERAWMICDATPIRERSRAREEKG